MSQEILPDNLTDSDKQILLRLARDSIFKALDGSALEPIRLDFFSKKLRELGASFVTITIDGVLRGCVGGLEPCMPLVEDVREHAIAAAFHDYRFPPLTKDEYQEIKIEISRLTKPTELFYEKPEQLPQLLRPNIDGVILRYQEMRATFLPQVWEKIPNPEMFLDHLCQKMGVSSNMWRKKILRVSTYQVENFEE